MLRTSSCLLAVCLAVGFSQFSVADDPPESNPAGSYSEMILADKPVAYWGMEAASGKRVVNRAAVKGGPALHGTVVGRVKVGADGPRPERYPLFDVENRAIQIPGAGSYVRIADPGDGSPLDFGKGDSITLEAWVNPQGEKRGGFAYVIGKGRTGRDGFPKENQNYALRLQIASGQAQLTFLFRNHRNSERDDYHRWTSNAGFPLNGWHHVAVSYTFGKADSVRGYIDGKPVDGVWDMGGKTDLAPVVDNDDVWIGTSMGAQANSTLIGGIDEVAMYRKVLSPERIRLRYKALQPKPYVTEGPLPDGGVLAEIIEGLPAGSWNFIPTKPTLRYVEPAFGFDSLPQKYDDNGLRVLRSNPFLVRMTGMVELPKGKLELHVRSRSAARVFIDGKQLLSNPFHKFGGGGHVPIKDRGVVKDDHIRTLQPGDSETLATFDSPGKLHRVTFEVIVGGNKKRNEPGETSISFRPAGSSRPFVVFAPARHREQAEPQDESLAVLKHRPKGDVRLTTESWVDFLTARRDPLIELEAGLRRLASRNADAEWNRRHEAARNWLKQKPAVAPPDAPQGMPVQNEIDRFIGAKLHQGGLKPTERISDWQFLRRATLDVTGTLPTPEQVQAFLQFEGDEKERRAKYIRTLLELPGWADHWTGYWQDVLAENPNILKPTLNNTGPFRWWIYESLYDNKPMDRFVTELVLMQGDSYAGGPAGFEMAAQNDVPMAAKAHIIGQAFLGVQLKCARCHDDPMHDYKQEDLFSLAAMLRRAPQSVPKSSSIPLSKEALDDLVVKVTLPPGSKVAPKWPFPKIVSPELPKELAVDSKDPRRQLAALITTPTNTRFAKVMVNRLWARLMGRGLVESVDDWEHAEASHPELLEWLAAEFLRSGYDQKHVAGLILNSHAYQREAVGNDRVPATSPFLFPGPLRRRMSAEQVVDSMFTAAGKELLAGELNMDVDGARPYSQFINLGKPRRSWEFTSLSNERDRPSLAIPYSQDFVSTLTTFGWRDSRQDPVNVRDADPTVLQPAVLANGVLGRRVTRLSDDGALTELAVEKQSLEQFIRGVYLRLLTRPPTDRETALFAELLRDGYEDRVIDVPAEKVVRRFKRPTGVSWSNHLRPEANVLKMEMEEMVERGDPPSVRLKEDWRRRAEDMIWALLNSPEFVFIP
jgi:hypothetical protein